MKKLSNSLLELATLGNYKPMKGKILISELFENIHQTMKSVLAERNIHFSCHNDVDVLEGQEDLIKSLLLNLCANAVTACSTDNGTIHLSASKHEEKTVLSVTDNGCGITKENIHKVTEAFYRIDKARSREHGGAGLGLTLCKRIAEVHGADLIIESLVDTGTTIKIILTSS
jgi:signal transduction histidine kinase